LLHRDVAIDGAIGFGAWYTIKNWLVSGGVAAIAVEAVFALATFFIASKAMVGRTEDKEAEPANMNMLQAKSFETSALDQEVADALAMAEKALKDTSNRNKKKK